MNAIATQSAPAPIPVVTPVPVASYASGNRPVRRERDFGIGYGRSSGYATGRSYTTQWVQPRFRCA